LRAPFLFATAGLLDPRLNHNFFAGFWVNVLYRVWDRNFPGLFRMLEVVVISGRLNEKPAIRFNDPYDFS
jgi:hypothetical protein